MLSQSNHAMVSGTGVNGLAGVMTCPSGGLEDADATTQMFSFIENEPLVDVYDRESQELLLFNLPLTG